MEKVRGRKGRSHKGRLQNKDDLWAGERLPEGREQHPIKEVWGSKEPWAPRLHGVTLDTVIYLSMMDLERKLKRKCLDSCEWHGEIFLASGGGAWEDATGGWGQRAQERAEL